jgi:NADPH:quinone reductase-like Zn-dependent oxidoreductase
MLTGIGVKTLIVPSVAAANGQELANFERLFSENSSIDRVVHLGSLDTAALDETDPTTGLPAIETGCRSVLHLAQALARRGGRTRLFVVTRGARAVGPDAVGLGGLPQAAVWGLVRTLRLEHPELTPVALDLDPGADNSDAATGLLREAASDGVEPEVAIRGGERFVPRLHRTRGIARREGPLQLSIGEPGVLENLELVPATRRAPGPNEVEIRVAATGLNFRDVMNALGMLPGPRIPLGLECVGTVVGCGSDVQDFRSGDVVVAMTPGSFSSFVTVPADFVAHKPASLSIDGAATVAGAFATAAYGLERLAQIRRGERILIHAAAGGVGMAAVQLAQRAGLEIFATAGRADKRDALVALGVRHVFDSRSLQFAQDISARTGGSGVDVVLNSLAGEFVPASLSVLGKYGRFLELGKGHGWSEARVKQMRGDISYVAYDLGELARKDPGAVRGLLRPLLARFDRGELTPLPQTVFSIDDAAAAFRFMAGAKHIGKIVVRHEPPESSPPVRADGMYVVTGGLGALGLHVAGFLVDAGARHLALVGRSDPSEDVRRAVAALESKGAEVLAIRADVSSVDDMRRVLAQLRDGPALLRGIVHAAGVLDDGVVAHQNWERFQSVLDPKAIGAWNLHCLTRHDALDFFVLFSSATSLLGGAGQSSYAAASEVLDALAHYRRAAQLPAVSINWGAWNAGMAIRTEPRAAAKWSERGIDLIAPREGLNALGRILTQSRPQVGVLAIDVPRLAASLQGAVPPVLSSLVSDREQSSRARTASPRADARRVLLRQLDGAPKARRQKILVEHVRAEAGRVLGLDQDGAVDVHQSLGELGLDSLLALELRNALAASLERSLPLTLLFDYPTIEALGHFLERELFPAPGAEAIDGPRSHDELNNLSVDELAALLSAELDQARAEQGTDR